LDLQSCLDFWFWFSFYEIGVGVMVGLRYVNVCLRWRIGGSGDRREGRSCEDVSWKVELSMEEKRRGEGRGRERKGEKGTGW
jgi:hypothetical protein